MTLNQQTITNHAPKYIKLYTDQFGLAPTSWFNFFQWIASFSPAGNFNASDIALTKELFNIA